MVWQGDETVKCLHFEPAKVSQQADNIDVIDGDVVPSLPLLPGWPASPQPWVMQGSGSHRPPAIHSWTALFY